VSKDMRFDILVVGAGPAGLSAALAFARDGFETGLVGTPDPRPNGRTVALLDGSVRFFKALGVGSSLARRAVPLVTMRIIDDTVSLSRPPSACFHAREIGLDALDWNIENGTLEGLTEVAVTSSRLSLLNARAESVDLARDHASLRLENGRRLNTVLIVAADGRDSRIRKGARSASASGLIHKRR
jgi:2-octaprenyl-6-methoxyphenol hydroxylase